MQHSYVTTKLFIIPWTHKNAHETGDIITQQWFRATSPTRKPSQNSAKIFRTDSKFQEPQFSKDIDKISQVLFARMSSFEACVRNICTRVLRKHTRKDIYIYICILTCMCMCTHTRGHVDARTQRRTDGRTTRTVSAIRTLHTCFCLNYLFLTQPVVIYSIF